MLLPFLIGENWMLSQCVTKRVILFISLLCVCVCVCVCVGGGEWLDIINLMPSFFSVCRHPMVDFLI
jgi:hypothetical protein